MHVECSLVARYRCQPRPVVADNGMGMSTPASPYVEDIALCVEDGILQVFATQLQGFC